MCYTMGWKRGPKRANIAALFIVHTETVLSASTRDKGGMFDFVPERYYSIWGKTVNDEEMQQMEEDVEARPASYGKCDVIKKIGEGGMGAVYLAKHKTLDMLVAVKVLPRYLDIKDPEYARRFFREARLAAQLRHPNIVRVIDSGSEGNHHYLVMEYVDGPTCRQKVEAGGRFKWQEAVHIVKQAAEGLSHAAQKGIIHRDVTPDNIMIDSDGTARITDLGLAKEASADSTGVTRTGASLGTPYYMSPEQINSARDVDFRSDIYSLGATMYHLVCGHVPYTGSTFEVMTKHVREPLPDPKKHVPDLPDAFTDVVSKMMAKSPQNRYQSYEQLVEDLDSLLQGAPVAAVGFKDESMITREPPAISQQDLAGRAAERTQLGAAPRRQSNKVAVVAAGAVLAAAILALVIYLLWLW